MKIAFLETTIMTCIVLILSLTPLWTMATEPLSDDDAIELARTAILNVPFDHRISIDLEMTNGLQKVVFPRKWSRGSSATNSARFAATVFIDPETRKVVPNPGLIPLSDEQAVFIATNAVPIPFDHSKTVRVDRASSVTRVTIPDKDREIAPEVFVRDAPLVWVWIDTETQTSLGAMMEAN